MTKWSPDTCACVFVYTDDGTLTLTNVLNKCPAHSSFSNDSTYTIVKDENPRLATTLGLCFDNIAALFDTNSSGARTLKGGISYNWSWSGTAPNRVLNVSFTGITLTTNQKNTIQSVINTKFGSGKVVIS